MIKILDIYKIPEKNTVSIVLAGSRPSHLKIGSTLKCGDDLIDVTGIPLVRPNESIDTGTFGVITNSNKLKIGDIVEII